MGVKHGYNIIDAQRGKNEPCGQPPFGGAEHAEPDMVALSVIGMRASGRIVAEDERLVLRRQGDIGHRVGPRLRVMRKTMIKKRDSLQDKQANENAREDPAQFSVRERHDPRR